MARQITGGLLLLDMGAIVLALATAPDSALGQDCELGWDPTIGNRWFTMLLPNGKEPGTRAFAVFDDGTGPALYSGGNRNTNAEGAITKWMGYTWEVVGGGVDHYAQVHALKVFDDGSGPALYAAGAFSTAGGVSANGIAKWDGTNWSPMAGGLTDGFSYTIVFALAVYDDGTGPALYAAGRFTRADGIPVRHIAKWNGTAWSDVGGGMDGMTGIDRVNALAVYDDGDGPALYAGGMMTGAGGVSSPGIVKWDGATWSEVAGGVSGPYPTVRGLRVFDDGTGDALYVGGTFAAAGGVPASRVARWDGSNWSAVGEGLSAWVTSFEVFDDGTGPALYAGGKFYEDNIEGVPGVNRVAKWNGVHWEPLGIGTDSNVYFLGVFDDGYGEDLYVEGGFNKAGGEVANTIARWGCLPARLDLNLDTQCPNVGDQIVATVHVSHLNAFNASGFEAYLSFDDSKLAFVEGAYTAAPFGHALLEPIVVSGGMIQLAAEIDAGSGQTPTSADSDLAVLVFETLTQDCDGTRIRFEYPAPQTTLINSIGQHPPHGVATFDSPTIQIGGVPADLADCSADMVALVAPGEMSASVNPTPPAPIVGCELDINGERDDGLELTDPYPVHKTTTITWTIADACGHTQICEQEITVGVSGILCVDDDAPPGGDGTGWASPFSDLQTALALVGTEYEIHVAQGVYTPAGPNGDRTASFALMDGVRLIGGFAGWGHVDPDERDLAMYPTYLSGDLNGNDTPSAGRGENAYHVVTAFGNDATAVLDGFIIVGGNAHASGANGRGAGLDSVNAAPAIVNCAFVDNRANYGAAVFSLSGFPLLVDCAFYGNAATVDGGAVYVGADALVATNCVFSGNTAVDGGACYLDSTDSMLVNCTFSANVATGTGGGLFSTDDGLLIGNCVLWGNSDAGGMDETAQMHAAGAGPGIDYSCVQAWSGAFGGTENNGVDPAFVDADGADNVVGTSDDDLRLSSGSACIDAGRNDIVPADGGADADRDCEVSEPAPWDALGNARFFDDPNTEPDTGVGAKPIVDRGAYEFGSAPSANADCDGDGIADLCETILGTSPDADENGVPDQCEPCLYPGDSGNHCDGDIYPNNSDGTWFELYDGNCVVDLSDLGQMLGHFGLTSGATREDGDIFPPNGGDGAVDLSDLGLLLRQYGDDCR